MNPPTPLLLIEPTTSAGGFVSDGNPASKHLYGDAG
jgi:hypothetical protein